MKGTIKDFLNSPRHILPTLALAVIFVFAFSSVVWGNNDETDKNKSTSKKEKILSQKPAKDDKAANAKVDTSIIPCFIWPFQNYFKFNPSDEMQLMQEQMDRIFASTFSRFHNSPGFILKDMESSFSPKMDISENKENYILRLDIPGVAKSDISIKVQNNNLVISGKRDDKVENYKDNKMIRYERSYGNFTRVYSLPGPFDKDKIKAKYENGVLTITVPKTEKTQSETEIKVE
jgi:HSP20 family protein